VLYACLSVMVTDLCIHYAVSSVAWFVLMTVALLLFSLSHASSRARLPPGRMCHIHLTDASTFGHHV
jgi:hypothetical protein